jgi:DNA-binding CsgD family transcriptional regulator
LIFAADLITPNVVVSVLVLLPLVVGVWTLSSLMAGLVVAIAMAGLALTFLVEGGNRPTIVLVQFAAVMIASLTRLYARTVSDLLAGHRHARQNSWQYEIPRTLDGVDCFTHGVKSLTRREHEVANLAARGYTAGQIANQLHIGSRTVESHLRKIYAKLLIGSRGELIRLARSEPGLNS